MRKCLAVLMLLATAGYVFAQEDADIPARFANRITPEACAELRDAYLNILRGQPSDPSLRESAVQQMKSQTARCDSPRCSRRFPPGLPSAPHRF